MADKPGRKPRFSWAPPRFVALPENRSGWLAVRRLARSLGRGRCQFVPLLLHGPPGAGKSHLAGALHEFAEDHYSSVRLNAGDWPRWDDESPPEDLRRCDLLVIEDLQHLPQWAAASLEVVLDQRLARRRGTLITSSKGPAELNLPSRLASRISAGLVIGLESLGAKSRRAILGNLARMHKIAVHDDALDWLAENQPGSGRQLQAAATRLQESAAASPQPLDLAAVQALFEPEREMRRPTLEKIVRLIGMRFGVEMRQLRSPNRHPNLVWPRQLSMHLARSLTTLSLAQIGEYFGRDHSTVRHACQKVEDALAIDVELPGLLREMKSELC